MSASAPQGQIPESPAAELAEVVRRCRAEGRFFSGLRRLYQQVDRHLAGTGGKCLGGGGCCRFDLAGHRLYLTAGELALLTEDTPATLWEQVAAADLPTQGKASDKRQSALRCPYQQRGRCSAHARRPLGCRLYFCRPAAPDGPPSAYEEFHRKIAALHERFGLPYLYVELTIGLRSALDEPQHGGTSPPEDPAAL